MTQARGFVRMREVGKSSNKRQTRTHPWKSNWTQIGLKLPLRLPSEALLGKLDEQVNGPRMMQMPWLMNAVDISRWKPKRD